MTLLAARMQGRLAETIFFPEGIHPDLKAMFNPEYLRRFGREGKRKRTDDASAPTPKKARIATLEPQDEGFGDTGFGDTGFGDTGFGDGGFGDTGFDGGFDTGFGDNTFGDNQTPPPRRSPSLVGDDTPEDEEAPTSLTGSLSHSTVAAAALLQKELTPTSHSTLHELTTKATPGRVRREDAGKMFFEVLVLASRDVIRVQQGVGFGEIRVQGKEGLFKGGAFNGQQQILV